MARRIIGENGRWFAPDCPPDKHGTYAGLSWWCECDPCLAKVAERNRTSNERRAHNRAILMRINRDHSLTAPARQGVQAPEEAEPDHAPPRSADPDPDVVPPPGPPTDPDGYIATVRAKLLAAGLRP